MNAQQPIITDRHQECLPIDELDRQIIHATQQGLPLCREPYQQIAEQLGIDSQLLRERMCAMMDRGIIRRVGIIPNHYRLGIRANGMSVWNISDEHVHRIGEQIGQLDFVSHCYQRPRFEPEWCYNLFAMVHGETREEVMQKVAQIAALIGEYNLGHDVLFSKQILKKAGLRIRK